MTISVIIPCRNEKGHIGHFLDSLLSQELKSGWRVEILVADGMSDDGTREELRVYAEKRPEVRIIDNPGRIVSTGLNSAIEAAKGEIIIRMDAHTVYASDYIRECVRVLGESGADNVGGPWVARGRGMVGKAIAAAFRLPFCIGGGKAHDPNFEGEVDTVYLGCWARSLFDRIGRFDPELVRNQDDEFNFRLRRSGGRVWQSPRIRSSYTPRGSISSLFRQYIQYGYWRVAVIRKHRALASWRHVAPAVFVSWIMASLAVCLLATTLGMLTMAGVAGGMLATGLTVYLLLCVGSAAACVGRVEAPVLLLVPIVIAVYHLSYGLGSILGAARLARRQTNRPPDGYLTALTR